MHFHLFRHLCHACCLVAFSLPSLAFAQGAEVAFGDTRQERNLPVEVTSDELSVNQNDGTAVFTGNVVIGQGEMRLSAPRVLVVYMEDERGIERLQASGGVTLVSGEDAAEAETADYRLEAGLIELEGNVLLVQGENALTADRMLVDTQAGTARMTGRVKTVIQPENEE